MRKVILALCLIPLLGGQSVAQFSGFLTSPRAVPDGGSKLGAYIGIYEDALGVLGQYRYGLGGYTDIGFKLGIIDIDNGVNNDAGADLAFDFKYQLLDRSMRDPIELSLGGVGEFFVMENFNIFSIMFATAGSYPVDLKNGKELEPYARLTLGMERISNGNDDTDFEIGFNLGAAFDLSKSVDAIAEMQFDDPLAFFLGLNFDL